VCLHHCVFYECDERLNNFQVIDGLGPCYQGVEIRMQLHIQVPNATRQIYQVLFDP
jgi:hypothetical protein